MSADRSGRSLADQTGRWAGHRRRLRRVGAGAATMEMEPKVPNQFAGRKVFAWTYWAFSGVLASKPS